MDCWCTKVSGLICFDIKNYNFNLILSFYIIQTVEWSGIKFPEARGTGVWLRSQRMKLPPGVGQRKTKAIEQELRLMNIGIYVYNTLILHYVRGIAGVNHLKLLLYYYKCDSQERKLLMYFKFNTDEFDTS